MKREELIKALRHHYDLPAYMLDSAVIDSCAGLPGWYWIKFCAAIKRNRGKILTIAGVIALIAVWLLIGHLALEELAR